MYTVRLNESYNSFNHTYDNAGTTEYDRYRELDDEIYKVLYISCWDRFKEIMASFFNKLLKVFFAK